MAPGQIQVLADVGDCLKKQIIIDSGGVFTQANFHAGIVPSAEPKGVPPAGYGADRESWATTLESMRDRLLLIDRTYYGVLEFTEDLIVSTLPKAFTKIVEDIAKVIIAKHKKLPGEGVA
jgi:hypothetical protein